MLQNPCAYGRSVALDLPVPQAVEAVKAALKDEGFGLLCEIDVAKTMKEKIGAEMPSYVILGACNPGLAYPALRAEPNLGLLLPCNVVVRESPTGTLVCAVDADKMLEMVGNPALDPIAKDASERLGRVLDAVGAMNV